MKMTKLNLLYTHSLPYTTTKKSILHKPTTPIMLHLSKYSGSIVYTSFWSAWINTSFQTEWCITKTKKNQSILINPSKLLSMPISYHKPRSPYVLEMLLCIRSLSAHAYLYVHTVNQIEIYLSFVMQLQSKSSDFLIHFTSCIGIRLSELWYWQLEG